MPALAELSPGARTALLVVAIGAFLVLFGRRRVSLPVRVAGMALAAAALLFVLWQALRPLLAALGPHS
jgi:hypothetical protein